MHGRYVLHGSPSWPDKCSIAIIAQRRARTRAVALLRHEGVMFSSLPTVTPPPTPLHTDHCHPGGPLPTSLRYFRVKWTRATKQYNIVCSISQDRNKPLHVSGNASGCFYFLRANLTPHLDCTDPRRAPTHSPAARLARGSAFSSLCWWVQLCE